MSKSSDYDERRSKLVTVTQGLLDDLNSGLCYCAGALRVGEFYDCDHGSHGHLLGLLKVVQQELHRLGDLADRAGKEFVSRL